MTLAVKINKTAQLVVPRSACRKAGFKSGQELEIKASGGVITVVPKLPNDDDEYTREQRRIIDARLAEAEADIKAGRVHGPFNTAKEMAAHIEARIKMLRAAKRKSQPTR